MNVLADLQKWYASNCDGEWEEEHGVIIETLDNPGWSVSISLFETNLDGKEFQPLSKHESEESWIECKVEGKQFLGYGDAGKLEEILKTFVDWAKSQNEDWLKAPDPMTPEEYRQYQEKQLWDSLGDEVKGQKCRQETCERDRIRYSVMCRYHHFEMVTGHLFSKDS